MKSIAQKVVFLGILVALGLALHGVERMLPLPLAPVPGAKLGLANIVTLVTIFIMPLPEVAIFVFVRTLLSSLFGGGITSFAFSLSGGLLSMLVMYLLCILANKWLSLPAISVIGALFHNIGQFLVAAVLVQTWEIFYYLPFLIVAAVFTGLAVGFTTLLLMRALIKSRIVSTSTKLMNLVN